jgi:hypothetical protein
MRIHKGRAAAVALLCVIAATVTLWSGPLSAASRALHSSAQAQGQAHAAAHTNQTGRASP